MIVQDKLLGLLVQLEEVNNKLLKQLQTNPTDSYDELIEQRDGLGEKIRELCSPQENQEALSEPNQELQSQAQKVTTLDHQLIQEIDIVTHKLQAKQQSLTWQNQRASTQQTGTLSNNGFNIQ